MISFSDGDLRDLGLALRYAESRRNYWLVATGNHDYFVASMADAVGYLTVAVTSRAFNQKGTSNTFFARAILSLNSF